MPDLFFKKKREFHVLSPRRRGYCNRFRLSVMLSAPKPLDEIQLVTHMNGACNSTFLAPPNGALLSGQKVKYH